MMYGVSSGWYVDEYHCYVLDCAFPPCHVWIQPRPPYCDRGRWIANIDPKGVFGLNIDAADHWPRYYFDLRVAMTEVEAFLEAKRPGYQRLLVALAPR